MMVRVRKRKASQFKLERLRAKKKLIFNYFIILKKFWWRHTTSRNRYLHCIQLSYTHCIQGDEMREDIDYVVLYGHMIC